MAPEKPNRRLGRGLDALFETPLSAGEPEKEHSALKDVPVNQIRSNPFQPRKTFKPDELKELTESLRSSGLLQPVTVRSAPDGNGYELIAGERRYRAAAELGWKTIPAVVKQMTDQEVLTLALVENLQRTDLNPVEEAEGYGQLIRDFGYTQQMVATMVGKDRSTVANVIRILQLPDSVRKLVETGDLTAGQARPLLGLEDTSRMKDLARTAVEKGWSAREIERRVRESTGPRAQGSPGRPLKEDKGSAEVRSLEQRLRKYLQTDVTIALKDTTRGTLTISFYSPEDLERIMELIGVTNNPQ